MASDASTAEPSRRVKLCGAAELENGQPRYVAFAGVQALRAVAFEQAVAARCLRGGAHRLIREDFHRPATLGRQNQGGQDGGERS
jgi:hypothetical protein